MDGQLSPRQPLISPLRICRFFSTQRADSNFGDIRLKLMLLLLVRDEHCRGLVPEFLTRFFLDVDDCRAVRLHGRQCKSPHWSFYTNFQPSGESIWASLVAHGA